MANTITTVKYNLGQAAGFPNAQVEVKLTVDTVEVDSITYTTGTLPAYGQQTWNPGYDLGDENAHDIRINMVGLGGANVFKFGHVTGDNNVPAFEVTTSNGGTVSTTVVGTRERFGSVFSDILEVTGSVNTIAHDPSPADAETDVRWDFKNSVSAPITTDGYLSWENDSEPDSYNVYFGTQSGSLTALITGYPGEDANSGQWFSPLVQILVTDQESNEIPPNGYREVVPGDVLTNPSNSATYTVYRVDRGHLVNTNYQYYVYATRVGEPAVDGDILQNATTPDPQNPQAVRLVVTDRFLSGDDAELAYFPNNETTYYWRIDSVWDSPADTQTGDEWSFTTKEKKYFRNYELVSAGEGGSGLGPEQGGIEGADWKAPNSNVIVAAAGNAIWYEDKI